MLSFLRSPFCFLSPSGPGASFYCTHYSVDFMNMVHLHLLCAHSGFVLMLWLSVLTLCRTIRGKPKCFKGVIDLTYVKYSEEPVLSREGSGHLACVAPLLQMSSQPGGTPSFGEPLSQCKMCQVTLFLSYRIASF